MTWFILALNDDIVVKPVLRDYNAEIYSFELSFRLRLCLPSVYVYIFDFYCIYAHVYDDGGAAGYAFSTSSRVEINGNNAFTDSGLDWAARKSLYVNAL